MKARELDRTLETNPQNCARSKFDVIAFGHQHAAHCAGANCARQAADAAARRDHNQTADAAEARARASIARCAPA